MRGMSFAGVAKAARASWRNLMIVLVLGCFTLLPLAYAALSAFDVMFRVEVSFIGRRFGLYKYENGSCKGFCAVLLY